MSELAALPDDARQEHRRREVDEFQPDGSSRRYVFSNGEEKILSELNRSDTLIKNYSERL